jgi:hypothetical protein
METLKPINNWLKSNGNPKNNQMLAKIHQKPKQLAKTSKIC